MEIIKRGTTADEEVFELECKYCKTLFKFTGAEGERDSDRDGYYIRVKCPVCYNNLLKTIGQKNIDPYR